MHFMTQSGTVKENIFPAGLHVAIIMDGSGRWAQRRGWPRSAGHRAGAEAVRRVVRCAPDHGVGTLTLFAFSSANWRRSASEATALMDIFRNYLEIERTEHVSRGVRLSVIGRRDRLPASLVASIQRSESTTAACTAMHLRLAIDYSAREAWLDAAARIGRHAPAGSSDLGRRFAETLAEVIHDSGPAPDVDLLIRTGGEQRLSDCLLWEGAFAEIIFSDRLWPDFTESDLETAIDEFHSRERRFGSVVEPVAS
jgi:undecaprenyl diphosphate synthase